MEGAFRRWLVGPSRGEGPERTHSGVVEGALLDHPVVHDSVLGLRVQHGVHALDTDVLHLLGLQSLGKTFVGPVAPLCTFVLRGPKTHFQLAEVIFGNRMFQVEAIVDGADLTNWRRRQLLRLPDPSGSAAHTGAGSEAAAESAAELKVEAFLSSEH